jgi:hypothetical protein
VQVSAILDVIRALEMSRRPIGRWMALDRGLRRQPHTRAATDAHDLLQAIVAERAGCRRRKDHVYTVALGKQSSDAERRLGVGPGQHSAAVPVAEGEIEQGVPADDRQ